MLIKNAYVYDSSIHNFKKNDIKINAGIIEAIGQLPYDQQTVDMSGRAIVPGLIDVHTHGRSGYDFSGIPEDKLSLLACDYAKTGVTTVMPTIASAPLEEMIASADKINKFVPSVGEADLCGVHLEGRYLCVKYKGAHAEKLIAPLCADELENEVFRMCRSLQISAAYELDTDGSFAKKAKEIGATLSLGHTSATYAEAKQAEENGVIAYTHLFNAMSPLHHRDGGAVCAAFEGKCFAELICDGVHISEQMIRLAYSNLGRERFVLITDSMEATGCPDGNYSIAGEAAVVKNGLALTTSGAIAGSTLTMDKAVHNLMRFCNIPLEEAIACATENPAKQIGVFDDRGSIEIGKRADLLVLENTKELSIMNIMINGNFI